jgi:aminomethyltransferase
MVNRLSLHALHLASGATFATRDGWELPDSYGDPAAEYAAVRQGVGLIDRGDLGAFVVTGRDRAAFLHAMLTNDVTSLVPGQGRRAALLDIHGKVQVILLLLADTEEILVLTPPGMAAPTLEALDKYLFSEKAYFKDTSAELAPLVLAGPEAPALVLRLAGSLPGEARWSHVSASFGGVTVRLIRGGVDSGEPEIWLLGRAADGPALWEAALAAGARAVGRAAEAAWTAPCSCPKYPPRTSCLTPRAATSARRSSSAFAIAGTSTGTCAVSSWRRGMPRCPRWERWSRWATWRLGR